MVMKITKADEMEMAINLKSMRLSWVFVMVALCAWCIVGFINDGNLPFIPFMIFCLQNIIFFSARLFITRQIVGNVR